MATVSDGMELDPQNTMALGHEMNHPKKVYHPVATSALRSSTSPFPWTPHRVLRMMISGT